MPRAGDAHGGLRIRGRTVTWAGSCRASVAIGPATGAAGKTWAENPESGSATRSLLCNVDGDPRDLSSFFKLGSTSDLEPWILQTAAKTVKRPSERRQKSRLLLFHISGKAPVENQAAHRLLDNVVPLRPGIAVWTRPSPSLQGTNGPSPPEEPLKNTSKYTQQSLYV